MKTARFPATLIVKVDSRTRQAIEEAANRGGLSMGEVTRDLLNEGLKGRGIEC